TMDYEIFQPSSTAAGAACAYTQRWGTTGAELFIPTAAPSKAARTYNVCGQVAAGLDLAAGSFTDQVVATVNF
ncbi:MAG TPA: spore coat protein U domain-containing protein, partial [Thermoanaerobaculia bacterium]